MTAYDDDLLRGRFGATAPPPMQDDWLDVQRRAHKSRRNRLVVYAFVAAIAVLLVGCAAAFGPRIVRFADANPSPPEQVEWLEVVNKANRITGSGQAAARPSTARRIVETELNAGTISMDVALTTEHGFCVSYAYSNPSASGTTNQCTTSVDRRQTPIVIMEPEGRTSLDEKAPGSHGSGASALVGWTTTAGAERIAITFEDGSRTDVGQLVKVSKPVDALFFFAGIGGDHTHFPHRATRLVVEDRDGRALAHADIGNSDPGEWTFPRFERPGSPHHGFPPAADVSRERTLVFPGTTARIWTAPAKRGALCFIFHERTGNGRGVDACIRRPTQRQPFVLDADSFWPGPGAGPTHPVLFWGLVKPEVRRVELNFQDGATDIAVPQDGFVVYQVPSAHHLPGTRLAGAVLRTRDGRTVRRIVTDPSRRDVYPCKHPQDPGLGPLVCP